MAYTGYKIHPTLKKVTNDVNEFPLDINNNLCSVSGLPQATQPNPNYDPSYKEPDAECDPILYESRVMTEYFLKDCGDEEYSNNVPYSTTLGQFTSLISQEDADNQAWTWLVENGQANADSVGVCSTTYCNEPETRQYFSTSCSGYPNPYYITIPADTFCDTDPDVVLEAVNDWFDTPANAQDLADDFGTCESGNSTAIFYKVTGDPCTSARTAIQVWYKNSDGLYYTDAAMTILANFYFFPTDGVLGGFKKIVDGVLMVDTIYPQCPIPPFYYDDMGTPADVSICGTLLLACYPDKHVVVLYDTSTGTNPEGTIIAGRLNVPAISEELAPDADAGLLNNPMMVEWVKDGGLALTDRFVVYSGGSIKSMKYFLNNGTLLGSTNYTDGDYEWAYTIGGSIAPTSTSSLVGLLTPQDTSLTNFWTPVSMTAVISELGLDLTYYSITVFFGLWNRTGSTSQYKIYATTIYQFDSGAPAGLSNSYTELIHTNTGYSTPGMDIIRDMEIIKSDHTVTGESTHKIIIVTPYANAKSKANDKRKFYNVHYIDVTVFAPESVVYTIGSHTNVGDFRNNTSTSGIWKNNLKAEINIDCDGNLYVYIKSSNDSFWNMLLRIAAVPVAAALVGTLAAFSLSTIVGWFTCAPCLIIHGTLGPATILVAVVIGSLLALAVFLFKPPPQRYLASSRIQFTYSGSSVNFTGSTYTSGVYSSQSWITNKMDKSRTIYMNYCDCSTGLYSMADGRKIKYGSWNSNSPSSTIVT